MSAAPVLGVSAVVLRGDAVLLVRRAKLPYAGCWSLPGGRVEIGESLVDAARREVAEETGLTIERLAFLDHHEIISAGAHIVLAVFAGVAPGSAEPCAGDDASDARFVLDGDLAGLATTPDLTNFVAAARSITAF